MNHSNRVAWIVALVLLGLLFLITICYVLRLAYKAWGLRKKKKRSVSFASSVADKESEMTSMHSGSPLGSPRKPESLRLPSSSEAPFSSGEVRHVRIQPLLIRRSVPDSPDSPRTPTTPPKTPLAKELGSLDPSLYTFIAEEEDEIFEDITEEPANLGQVHFTVSYDLRRSVLSVRLVKAMNLCPLGSDGTKPCNPYAIIQLQPDYRHQLQSNVQRKTSNPRFEETFEFEIKFKELQNQSLHLTVCSLDTFSSQESIGQVVLPLSDLDLTKENVYFTDLAPSLKHVELGELMVSLGYLKSAGRLTVVIIKARNLPAVNIKGTDPYVKVSLLFNGKRIKKKKTSTKKSELNPVFNEAVSFDMASELLGNSDLLLSVMHDSYVIGCVLIGGNAIQKGQEHWKEVQTADRPVAHWHSLQDPKKYY